MAQALFNPASFTAPKSKPMPVILVLDNSGSMSGGKIASLNDAVRGMLASFGRASCTEASFEVAIFTFGTGIHLFRELADAADVRWRDIDVGDLDTWRGSAGPWDDTAARGTPLGATLRKVKSFIEDRNVIPSRSYRPAVVLVSDGQPTDSWRAALSDFIREGRSAKCDRWAMAIGRDADAGVLEQFIVGATNPDGSPRNLLYARDAATLTDNFKFITMTVTNTVALASKSKVLTPVPVTVRATGIEARDGKPLPMREPQQAGSGEDADGFEW